MVNLIPPHARRAVTIEYYVRVVTVWLWLLSAALIVVGVLMFPVGLLVQLQLKALSATYAEAQAKNDDYQAAEKEVMRVNETAQELARVHALHPVWDDVALIYELVPDGVVIESISLTREKDVVKKITVTGEAATRSDLARTRDLLKSHGRFTAVELPLSNLAKDVELPFSITLDVKAP